jgi:hypothetical protein
MAIGVGTSRLCGQVIGNPSMRATRASDRSSDIERSQTAGSSTASSVSRRITIEPPQGIFQAVMRDRVATEALTAQMKALDQLSSDVSSSASRRRS